MTCSRCSTIHDETLCVACSRAASTKGLYLSIITRGRLLARLRTAIQTGADKGAETSAKTGAEVRAETGAEVRAETGADGRVLKGRVDQTVCAIARKPD